MVTAELGTKRTCMNCAAKFYDLGKMPVVCPKCETSFVPDILLPSREPRPADQKSNIQQWRKVRDEVKKPEVNFGDEAGEEADATSDSEDEAIATIAADEPGGNEELEADTKDGEDPLLEIDEEDNSDGTGLAGSV